MTATPPVPPLWSGVPGIAAHAPLLHWGLVTLALLWALLAARGRPGRTLLAGLVFVEAGLGFWTAALGRPYGLLEHSAVTREAAFAAVSLARGAPSGFLPGEPFAGGAWARLGTWGLPETLVVNLPTLLPLAVLPASAWLVHALWRSPSAPLAAVLWLVFSTGDLDALRGAGFVPGLWSRPAGSLGLLVALAAVLAASRPTRLPARLALGAPGLAGAALALAGPAAPLAGLPALLLLTLDQWPWWLLALPSWRRAGAAPWVLVSAGAVPLLAAGLGAAIDPWGAQALLRLGLVLASARTLDELRPAWGRRLATALERAPRPLRALRPAPGKTSAAGLALAALLAASAPGSFLAWWRPLRLDPAAHASVDPVPVGMLQAMQWVRAHTPPEAVFVAGEHWAAAVPVLGARRVLRAPALQRARDERRRARVAYLAVAGEGAKGWRNARRYRLTHLLAGPGDLERWGCATAQELEARGRFRLRFEAPGSFRVYELTHWQRPGAAPPLARIIHEGRAGLPRE